MEANEMSRDQLSALAAHEYINEIREGLQSKNRFFANEDFLQSLTIIFQEAEKKIPPKAIFYRARRYHDIPDKDKMGTMFEGYDADGSFVNKSTKWPTYGRMNPKGISALYIATDIRTAVTELHPYPGEWYSVATIQTNEPLRIADLSLGLSKLEDIFARHLAICVQEFISQGFEEKDYIFPQFIASYCQHLGYDGIAYRSKYATKENVSKRQGINLTVFNYKKCEAIGSKLHKVNRITIQSAPFQR